MPTNDKFEQFIKNKLDNYEMEIDPDLLFEQIEDKRNMEGNHRSDNDSWKLFLLLFLICSGAFVYSNFSKTNPKIHAQISLSQQELISHQTKSIKPSAKDNAVESLSKTIKVNKHKTLLKHNIVSTPINKQIDVSNVVVSHQTVENQTSDIITIEKSSIQESTTKDADVFLKMPTNYKSIGNSIDQSKNIFQLIGNYDQASHDSKDNKDTEIEQVESSIIDEVKKEQLQKVVVLNPLKKDQEVIDHDNNALADLPVANIKKRWFTHQISIYGGASLVGRTIDYKEKANGLVYNDVIQEQSYLNARDKNEKQLEAVTAGFKYILEHRSGIFVGTGVEYLRIAEKLDYQYSEFVTKSEERFRKSIDKDGGLSVESAGFDVEVKEQIDYRANAYNYHHFVQVPIFLGYQKQINRWAVYVQSGLNVNLSLRSNGMMISPDLKVVDMKYAEEPFFKDNAGLSVQAGIGVRYTTFSGLNIFVEHNNQYFLNSMSSESNVLDQKYQLTGLKVGLGFSF